MPLALYDEVTSIDAPLHNTLAVTYDAETGTILCTGVAASGATATLYNMGGLSLGTAAATGDVIALPVHGVPHGSYLVVVRDAEGEHIFKILL